MNEMNQAEVAREETEQKMLYKILDIIAHSETKEEIEEKIRALLTK